MEIQREICCIVAEVSGEKGIDRGDHLVDELGLDDTQMLEVICRLEDTFDLSIPDEKDFETVADLILFVEANVNAAVNF